MARYDCNGKTVYDTFAKAAHTAKHQSRKMSEILHAYACKHCGRFHIGQQPLHAKAGKRPKVEIEE